MVGLTDPAVAFSFDLQCGRMLLEFEDEREQSRIAALTLGKFSHAFGAQPQQVSPLNGTRVGEITSANFRDQGF